MGSTPRNGNACFPYTGRFQLHAAVGLVVPQEGPPPVARAGNGGGPARSIGDALVPLQQYSNVGEAVGESPAGQRIEKRVKFDREEGRIIG